MKLHTSKNVIAATMISLLLVGCASNGVDDYVKAQKQQHERAVEVEQQRFDDIPDWFLNVPANTTDSIYAVGTANTNNLQYSLNQAKLNAEFGLAKALNQEITGRERQYMHQGTDGNVQMDGDNVITKFVDPTDIVGVHTVKNKVQYSDGKYIVYTLLNLDVNQQRQMLKSKGVDLTAISASHAYQDVKKEAAQRKEAKIEEAKSKQATLRQNLAMQE
ncbi:hypothetical protein GLP21_12115 [Photobacterium carnosum]|uniref:Flagellar biosynthesis protein FlgP n=1 Tax=Photobacterium carnosum TaxID=2023717 RepID=A0A2N4UW01_9GAMM|nr:MULTISPECIES: hypothetical protein [Photobacterium]MCD9475811.1 hypothetical protein [Photobacterium phosphoreum]MCD9485861.1 hypothetical protein [Photobacterium iliopiscarium]MCD9507672.1 hypothetical protein [Photobacterium phosphoreum]MCD9538207.1 hypothetical protein [Photobacterium carnosum]MCD9543011.1 hypothetical protein [Photobacterium carnosum]